MSALVLTDEQAKQMQLAGGFTPVVVQDSSGRVIGRMSPMLSPEMAAELKRRATEGVFFTGDQMRSRLRALEAERQRVGGFDMSYAMAFLERLNAADPGEHEPKVGG